MSPVAQNRLHMGQRIEMALRIQLTAERARRTSPTNRSPTPVVGDALFWGAERIGRVRELLGG